MTLDDSWHEPIARRVLTAQIIVGSLVSGCVIFAVIALMTRWEPQPGAVADVLIYMSIFFAFGALFGKGVVQAMVAARGRQSVVEGTFDVSSYDRAQADLAPFLEATGDAGRLWLVYLSRTIVGGAIAEGAAFFCLLAFLLTGSWLSLGLAAVLVLSVAMMIPTRASVIRWIENQLRLVEQQRQFSS
jgi:hypothetical protein